MLPAPGTAPGGGTRWGQARAGEPQPPEPSPQSWVAMRGARRAVGDAGGSPQGAPLAPGSSLCPLASPAGTRWHGAHAGGWHGGGTATSPGGNRRVAIPGVGEHPWDGADRTPVPPLSRALTLVPFLLLECEQGRGWGVPEQSQPLGGSGHGGFGTVKPWPPERALQHTALPPLRARRADCAARKRSFRALFASISLCGRPRSRGGMLSALPSALTFFLVFFFFFPF